MDPRLPAPKMRDDFRAELRARLMREAATALAPRPRGTAWAILRPALGVGLAAVVLIAGAGTAAAGSLPGDVTFPVKKAFENIQVTLTLDDVERVQLLGQLADRRLAELQVIVERADESKAPTASEEFAAAVARFRAAVDAIQRAAPAEKSGRVQELVDAARGKHEAVLDEVRQKLEDPRAQDAIERAKDQENKDTESENKDTDPKKTPRPARNQKAVETPRAAQPARATQRTEAPRVTPRPSGSEPDRD